MRLGQFLSVIHWMHIRARARQHKTIEHYHQISDIDRFGQARYQQRHAARDLTDSVDGALPDHLHLIGIFSQMIAGEDAYKRPCHLLSPKSASAASKVRSASPACVLPARPARA